jgi:hypothetical protein
MKSNAKAAMEESKDENLLTKLWWKVGQNTVSLNQLNEYLKLTNNAVTAILSSVEDE